MFKGLSNIVKIDLSNFDTSKISNMGYIFFGCSSLISINSNHFETSSVINMNYLFYGCNSLISLYLSNFDKSINNFKYNINDCNKNIYKINITESKEKEEFIFDFKYEKLNNYELIVNLIGRNKKDIILENIDEIYQFISPYNQKIMNIQIFQV